MSESPSRSTEAHRLDRVVASGVAWTTGAKWATQALTWASVLLTAKLLSPADFGLSEMASVVVVISNVLAEFGIGAAVVQMRELDRSALAQLNTVSWLLGAAGFVVSVGTAPWVAVFFGAPQLTLFMTVNSLAFFVTALQAIPQGLLARELDYRRMSIGETVLATVQAIATVGSAWAGMGYWSLLIGPVAGKFCAAVLTFYWKPVGFAIPRRREIGPALRFGMDLVGSRVAGTVYSLADGIVVGRMLGQSALGSYRLAMTLASAPAEKVAMLIMRVAGPLFANVQDDRRLTRRYFLFLSDALALAMFPLVMGLALVAPEAVSLLGPKWSDAILPMQLLAVYMPFRVLQSLLGQVLVSLRATRFVLWTSLLSLAVLAPSFWVATKWGLSGVAAAWLWTIPITTLPLAWKLFPMVETSLGEYVRVLKPAWVSAVAMVGAVAVVRVALANAGWNQVWSLAVQIGLGGAAYGAMLLIFFRPVVQRYWDFARRVTRKADPEEIRASV